MGSVSGLTFEAPYNLSIKKGEIAKEKMMKDAGSGVIITDTIGHGINYLTGDFSYGFFGYYFENGVINHPVTNMTVAGNIKDLFLQMVPLSDFEYKTGIDSPSLFVPDL